jgi:ABC-type sugar transport system permease subunit
MGQPPEKFNIEYGLIIALIVLLTAIIPFIIASICVRRAKGSAQFLSALFVPVLVSAVGYALFFYIFVAPNAPGVTALQVVPRSAIPGFAISAIFFISYFITRSRSNKG